MKRQMTPHTGSCGNGEVEKPNGQHGNKQTDGAQYFVHGYFLMT